LLCDTSNANVDIVSTIKKDLRDVLSLDDLIILYKLNNQLDNRFTVGGEMFGSAVTSDPRDIDFISRVIEIGSSESEYSRINLSDYYDSDDNDYKLVFDARSCVLFVSVSLNVVKLLGTENDMFMDKIAGPILSRYSRQYGDEAILKHPYFLSLMKL
jgi:hypothetical protein